MSAIADASPSANANALRKEIKPDVFEMMDGIALNVIRDASGALLTEDAAALGLNSTVLVSYDTSTTEFVYALTPGL
jgi:hypothetical protein